MRGALTDTIVAISTPPGRGGLGIVRISGPQAREVAAGILRLGTQTEWRTWRAQLAEMVDRDGEVIDEVVATFFESPRSFTGDDVVEISCHGSPVLLRSCVELALRGGARLAEPGEFTLRAFANGRIDLPQAEAIRDLIESQTLYQARAAARQLHGSVAQTIGPLKKQIFELVAVLEAGIDFADNDIEVAEDEGLLRRVEEARATLRPILEGFRYGRLVREGASLAIVGRPNVGKSSLFNRLLREDRALVTDIPGTTRDLVTETVIVGGIPMRFADTAGIRESGDVVEALGIERSHRAMADADITLVVWDGSQPREHEDEALLEKARGQGRCILVVNKADLPMVGVVPGDAVRVSAHSGLGLEALTGRIETLVGHEAGSGFLTNVRHERLLQECAEGLERAESAIRLRVPHEMLLLDLYAALRALDEISGATTIDDILAQIFSTFCIGK